MVSAGINPFLLSVVGITLIVFIIAYIMKRFKQPYVVAYILAGLVLGFVGFGTYLNKDIINLLGNLGVTMLLFFIGIHVSIPKLVGNWRVAIIGTLSQIGLSILFSYLLGYFLGWSYELSLLIGCVIALSSTAVILKILEEWKELDTKVGQNVLGILIVQDIAVVPMIILLGFFKGDSPDPSTIISQILVGFLIMILLIWLIKNEKLPLIFQKIIPEDKELIILFGLMICFGLSFILSIAGLSAALGAFIGGILISTTQQGHKFQESLDSFQVIFVGIFFVSIGLLMDVWFIIDNILLILLLVFAIFVINTFITTLTLRALGDSWHESFYVGGLLAQIGEFSFLLGAIGFSSGIIPEFSYQLIISVISVSLLFSPIWISIIKKSMHIDAGYVFENIKKLPYIPTPEKLIKAQIEKTKDKINRIKHNRIKL